MAPHAPPAQIQASSDPAASFGVVATALQMLFTFLGTTPDQSRAKKPEISIWTAARRSVAMFVFHYANTTHAQPASVNTAEVRIEVTVVYNAIEIWRSQSLGLAQCRMDANDIFGGAIFCGAKTIHFLSKDFVWRTASSHWSILLAELFGVKALSCEYGNEYLTLRVNNLYRAKTH
jgi:hypothetical protein